jgi:hypothetical protein
MQEIARGGVEYKFIRKVADGQMMSIGDLLRQSIRSDGNTRCEQRIQNISVKLPPHTRKIIKIRDTFPQFFEALPNNVPHNARYLNFHFAPNEATVETESGHSEVETIHVEYRIGLREYPSQVGQLLSYESSEGEQITFVEERDVPLGDGKTVKVVVT